MGAGVANGEGSPHAARVPLRSFVPRSSTWVNVCHPVSRTTAGEGLFQVPLSSKSFSVSLRDHVEEVRYGNDRRYQSATCSPQNRDQRARGEERPERGWRSPVLSPQGGR